MEPFEEVPLGPFSKAIAVVGVPSLVAVYLIWFLTTSLHAAVESTRSQSTSNGQAIAHVSVRLEQMGAERNVQMDTQIRLLRVICTQGAVAAHQDPNVCLR